MNAAFDIVVVTTNKNIVVPKDRFLRENEGRFGTTKVVYVVSPSIAKDIDALLSRRGFFAWKSTPDGSLSDDDVWKLVAKTPSGNHRVVLSSYFDERVADDFFQGARHTIRENDSEATVLAKNVFNLIGDVRRLTQSQGERIYASEAVLAAELRGN